MANGVDDDNGLSELTKRELLKVSEFLERTVFIDTDKELAKFVVRRQAARAM